MPDAKVILGDCLDVLRGMEASSVDAVVTDPPAGIGFMGKACVLEGFSFLGIEQSPEWHAIATRRIAEAHAEAGLFALR